MQLTHLGPYEIGKSLGKGGMGSVYAAVDTQTGQRVAIKALTPHLAMAEGFRERFEAEIESLKTLRHEGIVRLYGYGEQDGVLFYSMELVDGISLEDELKAGRRFNWREVSSIAIQLSHALKHAHDHGIVHRDIKPANILLAGNDQVKLADFGIARLFGTTQLTTAGGVLGTADYMSPEQAEGRPVTAKCDQYSLGGVMYALLAGRPPFTAKNLPQMLQLQRFANPEPVRRYAPDTPEQLERVIMQLLSKEPAQRFPNTQVLARHLQALVMALTRPAADDFALPGEPPNLPFDSKVDHALASESTRLEKPRAVSKIDPKGTRRNPATQDAATLAAEEARSSLPGSGRPLTSIASPDTVAPRVIERPSRFTTLEEEEARMRSQNQRSWILMAAQLASLAAVLAGMAALAMYLSRPPSADDLYQTVADRGDGELLATVEEEVNKFLTLYPNDPRANELERFKDKIELDTVERRLRRLAFESGSSDPSLLPVEQLYLRAADVAESSPEQAIALLESLVNLYGPMIAGAKQNDNVAAIVQLANRRLGTLRHDLAKLQERQMATLRERIKAADDLSKTDSAAAAGMFQAIIDLHEADKWAAEVVALARARLAELRQKAVAPSP
jgi:eukaryotic-like serine/threonine-protein kinase